MINYDWANQYNNFRLEALLKMVSDHSPLMFDFDFTKKHKGVPFQFELMWTKHYDLRNLIVEW